MFLAKRLNFAVLTREIRRTGMKDSIVSTSLGTVWSFSARHGDANFLSGKLTGTDLGLIGKTQLLVSGERGEVGEMDGFGEDLCVGPNK